MALAAGAVQAKDAALTKARLIASAIGLAAVLWLVLLSGWLEVMPGTVVTHRHNVIFSSDTNLWIERMLGHYKPMLVPIHPLQMAFWSRPCRAAAAIARLFFSPAVADCVGPRVVVGLITGTGIAWLAFLALRNGLRMPEFIALFLMYLLFTSNVTICLPEHFGISNGLLTLAFVAPLLTTVPRTRLIILGVLTPLLGGTTITNAIFPALSLVQSGLKSSRVRMAALIVGVPAALGTAYLVYRVSWDYHWFISTSMALRIVHNPWSTGAYIVYFLAAPVIGPAPLVPYLPPLGPMLSYEPLPLSLYAGIPAIGAAVWAILLGRCAWTAYQTKPLRPAVMLLLGWILFNAVFHNLWGDELMLYAPHWSWALMALVVLGAPHLSRRYLIASAAVVIACQIPALLAIKRALEPIGIP